MKRKQLLQMIINIGLILIFLVGCSSSTPVIPTPVPPSRTPLPTSTFTPTVTPTITPSPTSTPVPIPPMPTFQILGEYEDPIVEIMDQQGVKTTVKVRGIDTGDVVVNSESYLLSFPLKIADGMYAIINWKDFRRAYLSEGEYTVTLANEQEIKGQLDFDILDSDGKRYDLQSTSTMVLVGLSKSWLPFIATPANPPPGQRWQIHASEPVDLTFIVTYPDFSFEYSINTQDTQGNVISTGSDQGSADFFSLGPDDVARKLSSYDEIRFSKDDQITAVTNGIETTGTLFLIPDFINGVTFLSNKGTTSNWYLRGFWVEKRLYILLKKPICILTKISK